MMHDDETTAETSIRRTIRLGCEGLGLTAGEAHDIASRAIGTLRARKAGGQGTGAALPVAAGDPAPAQPGIRRKACSKTPTPLSGAGNDGRLIDHLVARWQDA